MLRKKKYEGQQKYIKIVLILHIFLNNLLLL